MLRNTHGVPSVGPFESDHRLITEARARDIWDRLQKFQRVEGKLLVRVRAWWSGDMRWARNRVTMAGDRRELNVTVMLQDRLGLGVVDTNQLDDTSLEATVRAAERQCTFGGTGTQIYDGVGWQPPKLPFPETSMWSDATFAIMPEQRGEVAQLLTKRADAAGLLAAGFVQMRVEEECRYGVQPFLDDTRLQVRPDDNFSGTAAARTARTDEGVYLKHTEAQCSMTVRHPKGTGSGWAGASGYDWQMLDAKMVAEQAFRKCEASLNPVAIEPGRYTVIMEPQAVAELVYPFVTALNYRRDQEDGGSIFTGEFDGALRLFRTKLGLQVVDERISISHDAMDRQSGIVPMLGLGPVTWIEQGVLKTLGYRRDRSVEDYALGILTENLPVLERGAFRMSGGTTSLDEMIASTDRGVLVSRFFGSVILDRENLLCTGVTRDGLWLIEKGKISKAVKNMRWTDSPVFALNQVEQLGIPVPVFRPSSHKLSPTIVPPIKTKDFAFTATIDAI